MSMQFYQLYSDSDGFVTKTRQKVSGCLFADFDYRFADNDHCLAPENLT